MPYKSKAQQRFMHARKPEGVDLSEWDRATKHKKGGFKKLPERVGKAGHWSDNLMAHHQAKVDYHQNQIDRLAGFKAKAQVKGATVGAKVAAKQGNKAFQALGGTKGAQRVRQDIASPFGKKNVKQMTGPELRRRRNKGVAEALTGSAAVTLSPAALVGADAQRDRVDSHMREGRAYLADRHVKGNSAYPSPTNPRRNLSHMPSGEWVARGSTAHEAMGHRMRTVRSIAADTKKLGEIKRAVGFSRAKRVGLLAAGGAALGGGTAAMIRGGHRADTASREILARDKAHRINRRANQINAARPPTVAQARERQYKRSADGEFSKRLPGEKRPEAFARHQKQAAGALTAAAAVPALMALRSGRAASVAMSEGNTALHATHAGRQLGHAATATALGGLAGATGALPVPRRILGYNPHRNKKPKIKSTGVASKAFTRKRRAHRPLHRIEYARPDVDRQFTRKGAKTPPPYERGIAKRSYVDSVDKKRPPGETQRDVAAGAGAVGTGAAYQAGGYAGVHRYTLKHNNVQVPRGVSQAKFDRVIGRHQRAHGVGTPPKYPLGRKVAMVTGQGPMQNVKANRTWPTKIEGAHGPVKVPGAIPRRILGFTHGGKAGLAIGAGAIAAGGAAGYKGIEAHQRKKGLIKMDVSKASDTTRRRASQAAGLGAIVAGGEAADRGISGLIHQRRATDFSRKAVGAQTTLRSAKLNLRAAQGARPKTGGFRVPHVPGAGGNPAAAARHAGSIASARGARNAFHAGAAIEGAKAARNFKVAGAAAGITAASALTAHALHPKKPFEKKLSDRESSNLALTGAGSAIGGTGLLAAGKQVRQNTLKVAGTHALKGNLGGALSHGVRGLKVGSALDRAGAAGVGAGVLGAGYALSRRKKVGKADDMSVDAWGVVRDDIEKAFEIPKIPTGVTKIPKIGMAAGKDAGSSFKSGVLGHPTVPKGPAGSSALKIGGMMRAHPAAAGTIGVGGTVGAMSLKPKKPKMVGMVKRDVVKADGFDRPAQQFFEAERTVFGDPGFVFHDPGIADFVSSPEVSSAVYRAVAVRYPQPVAKAVVGTRSGVGKDYYYGSAPSPKRFAEDHPLATTTGAAFAGGLAGASSPRMLRRAKKTIPKLKNAATAASTALKAK